jgi:cytochrome c oxidase subunit 3
MRPSSGGGARGADDGGDFGRGRGRGDGGSDGEGDGATPVSNARMLMILALIVSTMLFTGLIGAFIVLRGASESWPPAGSPPLPSGLAFNTLVILASSAALVVAHVAQRRGRLRATRIGLLAATAGAVIFLIVQVRCWREFYAAGVLPSTNVYFGNFYLLTMAHFAHAAIGLLLLLLASAKAVRGYLVEQLALPIDLAAMFWHFVDFAWIAIFLLMRG